MASARVVAAAFLAALFALLSAQAEAAVSCSAAEFKRAIAANGYRMQPDSKRVRMLRTISKLGGSRVVATKRELAMYLAQVMHESIGLSTTKEIGGEHASYAPYYGRGYIQLTGRSNYAAASKALYKDSRLVKSPNLVLKTDEASWLVTSYYWKTRVHNLKGVSAGKFGITTRGINGGECSAFPSRAARRCAIYKKVFKAFRLTGSPSCAGC